MDRGIKRVQVPLGKEHRDRLKDLSLEYEKKFDVEIGFAKIAAILVRRVLDDDKLARTLLYEGIDKESIVSGSPDPPGEYEDDSTCRYPKDEGRREAA